MNLDHGSHKWEFLKIMLAEPVLDEDSKVADASRYKALAFPKRPCLEKPPHGKSSGWTMAQGTLI